MAKAILSPVQFHGSTIFVVTHKGEPYAPIKPIVEDMGLDWRSQATKLRNNKERWGVAMITTPSTSGEQQCTCMPVRKLPAFFASINPNKVRPELRDRIRLYQDECDDALWNYWTKGQATRRPKAALPAVPQPTRQEQTAAALERFRTFQREFFKVGSELEHCLRDVYWMPGNTMPDNLKPFANGMNYGIQSLFCATCHTMEAMERYASAHIAGEELMRRGAQ